MATRLPPLHALTAFEAVARLHSYAVAAEELYISASALSHRIRLLEAYVGERLFYRDGRSIALSEFGRRYLDVVCSAMRTLTDFPMPHRNMVVQTKVKVMLPPTFARHLLVPRITVFLERYPEITVEIHVSVPLYDLGLSESDVEVRFGTGNYPNIVTEKLFEEPAFAVASPAYLARIMPLKIPSDLRHANLLRSGMEPWQPWFEAAGLKDWPEPLHGLRIDDLSLLLEAVRHGQGVGLTRQHFATELLARGEIVKLFDVYLETPPHAYYIVYEQQIRERPEVNTFIVWLKEEFKKIAVISAAQCPDDNG